MADRRLVPGGMDRHGIARPYPGCAGNCNQGRAACNCRHPLLNRVTCSELDLEVPPDADRVIKAPPPPTLTLAKRDRARHLVVAVVAMALLAFGVWIFPR